MGLSTHILDTHLGKPAVHVALELFMHDGNEENAQWKPISRGETDGDGRCRTLLGEQPLEECNYKLRFSTAAYFEQQKIESLYPDVEIAFTIRHPEQHYHIPLLISANGYSTYRGS